MFSRINGIRGAKLEIERRNKRERDEDGNRVINVWDNKAPRASVNMENAGEWEDFCGRISIDDSR